jgi:DNA-binding PadR family transcriptional regulator
MPNEIPLRPAVFHILLALACTDLHGLGIAQAIDDATDGAMSLGPGTLYRSLREMADDGLIAEVPLQEAGGDPRRRVYSVTHRGRELARLEATRLARLVDLAREGAVLPEAR